MRTVRENADRGEEAAANSSWQSRQSDMESWYRDLISSPSVASRSLAQDYEPYAHFLSQLSGTILDLGGGLGLVRDYLVGDACYIVVDPSLTWLDKNWARISHRFPSLKERPLFVKGIGEKLPFASGSFDVVLAFWSLNHALDPARCIYEAHRVLRPRGRALLVLEDMEPSWSDIAKLCAQKLGERLGRPTQEPIHWHLGAKRTVLHKVLGRPWPIQADHLRIREDSFCAQLRGRFTVIKRNWIGGDLSYELERSS
jgi:SAM-dependent methyltransferase